MQNTRFKNVSIACSLCFQTFPAPTIMDQLLIACVGNNIHFVSEYVRQNPDDSSPDWQFLLDVASSLGHGTIVQIIQQSGKATIAQVTNILYHSQYHRGYMFHFFFVCCSLLLIYHYFGNAGYVFPNLCFTDFYKQKLAKIHVTL